MRNPLTPLVESINALAHELCEDRRSRGSDNNAVLYRIAQLEIHIMSKISEFADKQKTFNDQVGAAIDGISADIKGLNDKITELQNSAGTVTPEDQALLDDLQARGQVLADKAAALDAATPPVPTSA